MQLEPIRDHKPTRQRKNEVSELANLLAYLKPEEKAELGKLIVPRLPIWTPLPGPQTDAYNCQADILFYGGSAGGGKSDLLLGLALTKHFHSIIYRREGTQLVALTDRLLNEILHSRDGWNGQDHILRLRDRQIEFGACKDLGDEQKYQGRPHDLKGFDEITHFLEAQFRFLCGWLRDGNNPEQKKRVVCAGNPPTNQDGQWVIKFWGPWLDDKHPNPAQPGELRWYTTINGVDTPVDSGEPFHHNGELITPLSRTFIPSGVWDNPFMIQSGYEAILQALPEPLRSQMLNGDFRAGIEDSIWQVIPTAWVDMAMARWNASGKDGQMDSVGVDVARGGQAKMVVSQRFGKWYAPLISIPGSQVPDGGTAAGHVIAVVRDCAPIHLDVIGVGSSVVDHLRSNNVHVVEINGASQEEVKGQLDKATGRLKFRNYRAMLYWRMREALDPKIGEEIALPPDPELKADLCAPLWKLTPGGILIEDKDQIVKRIGRSPDKGDAVVYGLVSTQKLGPATTNWRAKVKKGSWRSA